MKSIRGFDQVVFWIFMYLFILDYHLIATNWWQALRVTGMEICSYAFLVYVNYKLLIPNFLQKSRYVIYGGSISLLILSYVLFIRYSGLEEELYISEPWRNTFSMVLNATLFWLLSTLYWHYEQWQLERERQLTLQNEKLIAELKFLKTQISPHFIFNTLNNIYALALQKHDNTPVMVAKLSAILRYILYDCVEKTVDLGQELASLQDYIALQLLRKPASENVDFYVEGNVKGLKIAPLLLLTFVENCFKHSHLATEKMAWIKIECLVDTSTNTLEFITQNNVVKQKQAISKVGGIGLANVTKQLNLQYPNQHTLTINQTDEVFEVNLTLSLFCEL